MGQIEEQSWSRQGSSPAGSDRGPEGSRIGVAVGQGLTWAGWSMLLGEACVMLSGCRGMGGAGGASWRTPSSL